MKLNIKENTFFLLFFLLPFSIVAGPSVSIINILIIDLFFLSLIIINKNFFFLNHYSVKYILLLYLYLIFNSFISLNYELGLARNFGFLRLVLLYIFINYFFFSYQKEKKLLNYWTIFFLFFVLDIFIEQFTGSNILGWGAIEINGVAQPHGNRIVSFFKDEPITGSFLLSFIFLLFGHLMNNKDKKGLIPYIFLGIASFAILITGERSNSIKLIIGVIIFFLFLDFLKFKIKVLILFLIVSFFIITINSSKYLKNRYIGQIFNQIDTKEEFEEFKERNIYLKLYKSGFAVFKEYPIFGVGNKNYRYETCENIPNKDNNPDYYCLTHPHQIYFETLAEHGLFGTIILFGILFYLMFRVLKLILISKNYLQLGCLIYILVNFTPVLPSGSFFSDFNITLFWINFSIMFACDKKSNIFKINN